MQTCAMKNNLTRTLNKLQPTALIAVVLVWLTPAATAQQISPADQEYFEAKIRPILVDNCYGCHGEHRVAQQLERQP